MLKRLYGLLVIAALLACYSFVATISDAEADTSPDDWGTLHSAVIQYSENFEEDGEKLCYIEFNGEGWIIGGELDDKTVYVAEYYDMNTPSAYDDRVVAVRELI